MNLTLLSLYQKMRREMGPSGWWPADSKEEIIIGAIMIQNTNWRNADRAVANFRQATHFAPAVICQLSNEKLQELVRPAGFFRNKSKAVAAVFNWLATENFDYEQIKAHYGPRLRDQLLALRGIGQETADVLLTYIFGVPTFISDKYVRTLFTCLGISNLTDYQSLAKRCQLPTTFSPAMAQDFHGLIDEFGKQYFHPVTAFSTSFLKDDQLILR